MRNAHRWITRLVLLLAVVGPAPVAADCAGPSVRQPAPVAAGEDLLVTGEDFAATCNDTGIGCSPPGPSPPERGILVELQGRRDTTVARVIVDANEANRLSARLPIPASTAPGDYKLLVSSSEPIPEVIASLEVEILAP